MFQPPKDKPNECNARMFLSDDHGDGRCTIRCGLAPGHKGGHVETYKNDHSGRVKITWVKDERFTCERHGIQPVDECKACYDAPVLCSVHGMQESNTCHKCYEGNYVCPVHGERDNSYGCWVGDCDHDSEERWTKVYDTPGSK